ncbi:hypothetical protein V1477_007192 [Vespula maculifrons]|uniref:Uncharacterized protein n=1 Tax=Vespula maculifrons TaxID=7453 RepID=A0ABD2CHU2_VESMC
MDNGGSRIEEKYIYVVVWMERQTGRDRQKWTKRDFKESGAPSSNIGAIHSFVVPHGRVIARLGHLHKIFDGTYPTKGSMSTSTSSSARTNVSEWKYKFSISYASTRDLSTRFVLDSSVGRILSDLITTTHDDGDDDDDDDDYDDDDDDDNYAKHAYQRIVTYAPMLINYAFKIPQQQQQQQQQHHYHYYHHQQQSHTPRVATRTRTASSHLSVFGEKM